jgi:hypothetical protein
VATVPTTFNSSSSLAQMAADPDGFVQIKRGSMKKVLSKGTMASIDDGSSNHNKGSGSTAAGSSTNGGGKPLLPKKPAGAGLRRTQSQPASMEGYAPSPSTSKKMMELSSLASIPSLPEGGPSSSNDSKTLSPDECGTKSQSILKEYFVGGDIDDTVLSLQELILADKEGGVDRAAKVMEASTLMVMEMKETEVQKVLAVFRRCCCSTDENGKECTIFIAKEAILVGLKDPLEFLSDIEIDAPLARSHLALMLAQYMEWGIVSLDALTLPGIPEYFKTDGKPAALGIKILQHRNKLAGKALDAEFGTAEEMAVLDALMTDRDKEQFASAKDMIAAVPALA